jgi:hypothetical protein
VWPDNDKAGAKYAEAVAERLRDLGCTVDTLAVAALGVPEKGDCIEWLAANPRASGEDVVALPRVVAAAPAAAAAGVLLIEAAGLTPEPIRWVWPGWLARGKLHVLAGAPGTGKTTLAMDIAACVSAGRPLPSGWRPARGHVLIWSGEDDPSDTLVPRLIAAGADMTRVRFIGDVRENGERYPFDPATDVPKLAAAVASIAEVALLVVDPLVSAVAGDSHKNAEVRRGLAPLVDLAARLDAALLGITHYSKGTQGRDPLERVSGSLAFGALARIALGTVRQDSEEGEARKMMLARAKSNIGPDGGGFSYAFEEIVLPEHGGLTASRIVWGEAIEGTARELLAEADPEGGDSVDAAGFLRELLRGAPRPAKDVYREAEGAGYSRDQMKRAKRRIGVDAVKIGMDGGWLWRLPADEGSAEGSEGSGQKRPRSSLPSDRDALPSEAIDL